MTTVQLNPEDLVPIRDVTPLMMSYNVEMTEVTGGTFWRRYTPEQIAGTERFDVRDLSQLAQLMEVYPPKDLYDERLRRMTKALGPAWIRVSGSWASNTYYDLDDATGGKVPQGFSSVLTREQWIGVLNFVKAVDGHLMVSVANSAGVHDTPDGSWNPEQARLLFDFSRDYGVPVEAAEFMNEPNMITADNAPDGYGMEEYARDQDLFFRFVRENYPGTLLVGPCAADCIGGDLPQSEANPMNRAVIDAMTTFRTTDLLPALREPADVYSYHQYNGISERGANVIGGHWDIDEAMGERYLSVAERVCSDQRPLRDEYAPGAPMWVTETGDAGLGGDTWASTYREVFRAANELGVFGELTDGVLFHNTLASSDYGYLDHADYTPRPSYWFVYLWNRLMGTTVFGTGEPVREGVHLYARSRKDGGPGAVYLLVNNSPDEPTVLTGVRGGERYLLDADDLHAATMRLNGTPLELGPRDAFPSLDPVAIDGDEFEVPPASVAFVVL